MNKFEEVYNKHHHLFKNIENILNHVNASVRTSYKDLFFNDEKEIKKFEKKIKEKLEDSGFNIESVNIKLFSDIIIKFSNNNKESINFLFKKENNDIKLRQLIFDKEVYTLNSQNLEVKLSITIEFSPYSTELLIERHLNKDINIRAGYDVIEVRFKHYPIVPKVSSVLPIETGFNQNIEHLIKHYTEDFFNCIFLKKTFKQEFLECLYLEKDIDIPEKDLVLLQHCSFNTTFESLRNENAKELSYAEKIVKKLTAAFNKPKR